MSVARCRSIPAVPAMLVALVASTALHAASFRERGTAVEIAVYDFEVAAMCGLVTGAVQRGFHHHLKHLVRDAGLDRQRFEEARMRGWTAADREWANRGLGGFRGWCRDEGAAAAARFAGHDPGDETGAIPVTPPVR